MPDRIDTGSDRHRGPAAAVPLLRPGGGALKCPEAVSDLHRRDPGHRPGRTVRGGSAAEDDGRDGVRPQPRLPTAGLAERIGLRSSAHAGSSGGRGDAGLIRPFPTAGGVPTCAGA